MADYNIIKGSYPPLMSFVQYQMLSFYEMKTNTRTFQKTDFEIWEKVMKLFSAEHEILNAHRY